MNDKKLLVNGISGDKGVNNAACRTKDKVVGLSVKYL